MYSHSSRVVDAAKGECVQLGRRSVVADDRAHSSVLSELRNGSVKEQRLCSVPRWRGRKTNGHGESCQRSGARPRPGARPAAPLATSRLSHGARGTDARALRSTRTHDSSFRYTHAHLRAPPPPPPPPAPAFSPAWRVFARPRWSPLPDRSTETWAQHWHRPRSRYRSAPACSCSLSNTRWQPN